MQIKYSGVFKFVNVFGKIIFNLLSVRLLFVMLIISFYSAKAQTKSSISETQNKWELLGPKSRPLGKHAHIGIGRTESVWISPDDSDFILVGAATGGLWKTIDGGKNWRCLTDSVFGGVWDIAVHPNDYKTIYIATGFYANGTARCGYYGYGVYKSTDGGVVWKKTMNCALEDMVFMLGIVIDQNSPEILYAVSHNKIYKTINAAKTWKVLYSDKNNKFKDILLKPNDSKTIYVNGEGCILRSQNAGKFWEDITSGLTFYDGNIIAETAIAVWSKTPELLYAIYNTKDIATQKKRNCYTKFDVFDARPDTTSVNKITKSQIKRKKFDKKQWSNKCVSKKQVGVPYAPELNLLISDDGQIYAGGLRLFRFNDHDFALISNNNNTFSKAFMHSDIRALGVSSIDNSYVYIAHDGGLSKFYNKNNQITDISGNLAINQFYDIAITEDDSEFMAGGTHDCGTYKRDSSKLWTFIYGGDGGTAVIDYSDKNIIYATCNHRILRSNNGGVNWKSDIRLKMITHDGPIIQHPVNSNEIFAGAYYIKKSIDKGRELFFLEKDTTPGGIFAAAISKSNPDYFYYSKHLWSRTPGNNIRSNVWRMTVNGANLKRISAELPFMNDVIVSDIEVHPDNHEKLWITCGKFSSGNKVLTSDNAGDTWWNVSYNLPNITVQCLVYDKISKCCFIGTDLGVFYKVENTDVWKKFGVNLPVVFISELAINNKTRQLVAATYGRGIWRIDLP